MLDLVLFLISFFLVSLSSLFFTVCLKEKKLPNLLIYFGLIFVSQLIISFEVLSLLISINLAGVLTSNSVFFISAAILWFKNQKPFPDLKPAKAFSLKLFKTIKSDKILLTLSVLFIFSCLISLFFVIFVPTCNMDSHVYKLARAALWIQHKTLAHFDTTDLSLVIYPINWELMLLWPQVFFKRDYLSLFPAFFSYLSSLSVIFAFLRTLKISIKRALWAVLIAGSLPIVILEATSTQSDIFIGALLISSFYLFYYSLKNNEKLPMIFSCVAYAVAFGSKSTAVLLIPVFAVVFMLISIREKKKEFYKPAISFILYFIPAFLLLSAYNYILNYLSFGNFFAPPSFLYDNIMPETKALIPSIGLYIAYFADFSGINAITAINDGLVNFVSSFLNLIGLTFKDVVYMGIFEGLNWRIHENHSSFGLLGYLLIFPITIFSLIKLINYKKTKDRAFYLSVCGIFLAGFILIILLTRGFSVFNFRYFTTAIILAAPVLAFSYSGKNSFYKILISSIIVFNYIAFSLFNNQKPFFEVISLIPKFNNFNEFRKDLRLRNAYNFSTYESEVVLLNSIKNIIPDNSKIGLVYDTDDIFYPFFEENITWKIFPVRYDQLLEKKNFGDYDYLIVQGDFQTLNYLTPTVIFNYFPDEINHQIVFKNEGQDSAKILYLNRKAEILFEGQGQPIKMVNILEQEKFLKHYKKLTEISTKYPAYGRDRIFRIYYK